MGNQATPCCKSGANKESEAKGNKEAFKNSFKEDVIEASRPQSDQIQPKGPEPPAPLDKRREPPAPLDYEPVIRVPAHAVLADPKVEEAPKVEEEPKIEEPPKVEEPPKEGIPKNQIEPAVELASSLHGIDIEVTSVDIDFDAGGSVQTVTAVRKPLGLIFDVGRNILTPMTVGNIRQGSHGEELGVKLGWVMKAVAGEDVSNMSTDDALKVMHRHLSPLPNEEKSVELVFVANGQEQTVVASRSPFGVTWGNQVPLTVNGVTKSSHADKLRVQPGWSIKAVAGQDVSKLGYAEARDVFQRSVQSLPLAEK